MERDHWMTVGEAVAYLDEPIERVFKLLEQDVIASEIPGRGISQRSCDIWMANQKVRYEGAQIIEECRKVVKVTKENLGHAWTRAQDRILIGQWWDCSLTEIGGMVGKTADAVNCRGSLLRKKGRLPKNPPGYIDTVSGSLRYKISPESLQDLARSGAIRIKRRKDAEGNYIGRWYLHKKDLEAHLVAETNPTPQAPTALGRIDPEKTYWLPEAADLAGITYAKLYGMSQRNEIPSQRVTVSNRSRVRVLGKDILSLQDLNRPEPEPESDPAPDLQYFDQSESVRKERDALAAQVIDLGKARDAQAQTIYSLRETVTTLEARSAEVERVAGERNRQIRTMEETIAALTERLAQADAELAKAAESPKGWRALFARRGAI